MAIPPPPSTNDQSVPVYIKALAALAPNLTPLVPSSEYQGRHYDVLNLSFRPALFVKEGFIVLGLISLFGLYYLGSKYNENLGKKWIKQHESFWNQQFKSISPAVDAKPLNDGPSVLLYFLTGRRNLLSVHITQHLLPRHNPVQMLLSFARGFLDIPYGNTIGTFSDEILIDITLGEGDKGIQGPTIGVWGIAQKGGALSDLRTERWDSTFTKSLDQEDVFKTKTHMVLQEVQDSTDVMFGLDKKTGGSYTGLTEMCKSEKEGGGIELLKWMLVSRTFYIASC